MSHIFVLIINYCPKISILVESANSKSKNPKKKSYDKWDFVVKKLNVNNEVGKIIISIFQRIKPNVRLVFFFFLKMFQSSTHSIKNAGRYFEQFVKVSLPKNGGTNQVKNLPASLYTSPKSKYNSYNSNGNGNYKNSSQKK